MLAKFQLGNYASGTPFLNFKRDCLAKPLTSVKAASVTTDAVLTEVDTYVSVHYNSVVNLIHPGDTKTMLKNITLSAEENMIHHAREKARQSKKTLNVIFREWLARYVKDEQSTTDYYSLMKKLKYAKAGKHFSRDELNER